MLLSAQLVACSGPNNNTLTVVAYRKQVVADDGYVLSAFDLHTKGSAVHGTPRAWMFYLVGSEPVALQDSTQEFADLVARGVRVVLLQPRGVGSDASVNQSVFWQYDTRQHRVSDEESVMDAYLTVANHSPVLLVGSSEGGIIAADIAIQDKRVTHLLMMASGGGWTQAKELQVLVQRDPGYLGMANVTELDAEFAKIAAQPSSGTLWAGHPFRHWSSYLWYRPADGLTKLSIPMFLAQGAADQAVPVDSARALRDAFAKSGLDNLRYEEYPGLDHHFDDASGKSRLSELQKDAYAWMTDTGVL